MSESSENRERRGFSRTALGLANTFRTTIILGAGGAVFAPTNESAAAAAGVGFVIDMYRLVKDKGEQAAANLGVQTKAQKDANRAMERQIREREQKRIDDRMNF